MVARSRTDDADKDARPLTAVVSQAGVKFDRKPRRG